MQEKTYDLVLIGGGPAALSVAYAAREAGKSVAIAEGYAYGGACPLRGCDPKMVLHGVADALYDASLLCGRGILDTPEVSWPQLMKWKRTFTEPVPAETRKKLREAGIEVYTEFARFDSPRRVVMGEEEDSPVAIGDTIVIATGGHPTPLGIPGEELAEDSEYFLDMDELPDHLTIIGGGYIGTGFANIAQIMGAKVEVIDPGPNPADKFDSDMAARLRTINEERGIVFHTNSKATRIEGTKGNLTVTVETEDGGETTIETNLVIGSVGRTPNLEKLQLEKAGVRHDKQKGIAVNDQLRTNVDHIYALGDCNDQGLPLTPVATHESRILVDNLFHGKDRRINYLPIPTVCFSAPAIASVGLLEQEAQDSGKPLRINHEDATDYFHAHRLNAQVYAYKIIIDDTTDEILGAHLLGPQVEELINIFALAIHNGITAPQLRHQIYGYPTAASDIGKMVK